jgi:DNA-binding NarL/FixJ family response regulator
MIALGGIVWHPDLIENCVEAKSVSAIKPDAQGTGGLHVQLSPRESQLLSLLVAGKTNKQISQELKLAQVTVKKALQVLFPKIGVTNRTQAAIKASQLGLLTR